MSFDSDGLGRSPRGHGLERSCTASGTSLGCLWPAFGLVAADYYFYRPIAQESAEVSAAFTMCSNAAQRNCVIDGDTFRLNGERIRVEDIDAPEIFSPKWLSPMS